MCMCRSIAQWRVCLVTYVQLANIPVVDLAHQSVPPGAIQDGIALAGTLILIVNQVEKLY